MYGKRTKEKMEEGGSMARLESCSVETLRAMAKNSFLDPSIKRKCTMIANRKEGLKQAGPTPAQSRARLLANIAFQTAGGLGNINNCISQFHKLQQCDTDMTVEERARVYAAVEHIQNAYHHMENATRLVSLACVKRLQEKNKLIKENKNA